MMMSLASFFLFAASLFSLASGSLEPQTLTTSSLSILEQRRMRLTPQQRHPALYQLWSSIQRRRRLQDQDAQDGQDADATDDTYTYDGTAQDGLDDGSKSYGEYDFADKDSEYGCQSQYNRLECKMSFGQGAFEIDEGCTTSSDNSVLTCNVCAVDNQVQVSDGSFAKFCYEFQCSVEGTAEFHGDFASACNCLSANVNGELCAKCEFCSGKAQKEEGDADHESDVSLLTPPLALECPYDIMDSVNSQCPAPEDDEPFHPEEKDGSLTSSGDEGMSGGAKFGVFILLFSVLGAVIAIFVVKRKRAANSSHSARGSSGMDWPQWPNQH